MTEAKFVLTLDPTPLSRFEGYQRPCPADALVIVSSQDQTFRQCVRAGDRHWGPGGDVSEPIRFWRPVTFGEARRLFDGRTVTGLAYRDGFVVMEPRWASALPVRCVDAESAPEPIVSKTGGGFILDCAKITVGGREFPGGEAEGKGGPGGWPAEDPVQALGLADPGDVFERPGAALRRLFMGLVDGSPFLRLEVSGKLDDLETFWATLAGEFAGVIGHGAKPQPTDLPMDGNAPTYRQIAEQALRALDEASLGQAGAAAARAHHTRLSALLEGADAAVAQGVDDELFATDAPPEDQARVKLVVEEAAPGSTSTLQFIPDAFELKDAVARYVRPFSPAPSTLHRPGTDAYDNAMERLVLELVRRVQTMEQR